MAIKIDNNYRGLLYDFTANTSTVREKCTTTTGEYREPDVIEEDMGVFTINDLQSDYNEMINSVIDNKGFYVGKYELGLEGETAVCKKRQGNIILASVYEFEDKWYGLYKKSKEFANKESSKGVVSTMMWGSQYDAMLNWIIKNGETIDENSKNKQNLKNICELFNNNLEYTIEVYASGEMRAIRGKKLEGEL